MPLERVSRGFRDISMSFQSSPLNNDILAITNETAIARSIRNIVLTQPGERFFNNKFGSFISNSLFENMNDISADYVSSQIRESISNYEPRVELKDVKVIPNYETLEFEVIIEYKIIGIDAAVQQLSFALEQTR